MNKFFLFHKSDIFQNYLFFYFDNKLASTFNVCPALSDKLINPQNYFINLSHQWESNPRPDDYESAALPTELWWRFISGRIIQDSIHFRNIGLVL